jgi:thioredoxin 1
VGVLAEMQIIKESAEFEAVLKTKDKLIALVYATWCPFCMRFLPVFRKYAGDDRFILMEDNDEKVAEKYDVDIIPTVLIFENGKVVQRLDGVPGRGLTEPEWLSFLKNAK